MMILPLFLIRRYGKILRSKSKYAPVEPQTVAKNDTIDSVATGKTGYASTVKTEPTEVVYVNGQKGKGKNYIDDG